MIKCDLKKLSIAERSGRMSEEGEERSLVGNEAERKRVEELERADYQKTLKVIVTTHARFFRHITHVLLHRLNIRPQAL